MILLKTANAILETISGTSDNSTGKKKEAHTLPTQEDRTQNDIKFSAGFSARNAALSDLFPSIAERHPPAGQPPEDTCSHGRKGLVPLKPKSPPGGVGGSRLSNTNCDTTCGFDENVVILNFMDWLKKRDGKYIELVGIRGLDDIGIKIESIHRWTGDYAKKKMAGFYRLRDWYNEAGRPGVFMGTFTVPHNKNRWGRTVNFGHNFLQAFENLKQGFNRIRGCAPLRGLSYALVYEPHPKSGYAHIHALYFGEITEEEEKHVKELWHNMTGANIENGLKIERSPPGKYNNLAAYLISYAKKRFSTTRSEWKREDWVFNGIAWKMGFRLFSSSRDIGEIMFPKKEKDESIEWKQALFKGYAPRYDGDDVDGVPVWQNKTGRDTEKMVREDLPSKEERLKRWKEKTGWKQSFNEILFQNDLNHPLAAFMDYKEFRLHRAKSLGCRVHQIPISKYTAEA